MSDNDLILYTAEDGQSRFALRELGGQVWLTQLEIAPLYLISLQGLHRYLQASYRGSKERQLLRTFEKPPCRVVFSFTGHEITLTPKGS